MFHLQYYEYLGGRLDHVVETADMLVAQVLHGVDLNLHTGQVLLNQETPVKSALHSIDLHLYKGNGDHFLKRAAHTLAGQLTPSSFLSMILIATISPVSRWRPSFTLAKPPEKETRKDAPIQNVVDVDGFFHPPHQTHKRYDTCDKHTHQ